MQLYIATKQFNDAKRTSSTRRCEIILGTNKFLLMCCRHPAPRRVDELRWNPARSGELHTDQKNIDAYHRYGVFSRTGRNASCKSNFLVPRRAASRRTAHELYLPVLRDAARQSCRFAENSQRTAAWRQSA